MKIPACLFLLLICLASPTFAQSFLVQDGQPRAEIVIAAEAPRSTRLAARELQETLEKISGARLPVVTAPTSRVPVRVLVGESASTKALGLDSKDLAFGAYRIVSGDNWLALLGQDTEFEPKEPWAKNNSGRKELQARWEEASGLRYGVPNGGMYKNRQRMPTDLAREEGEYFWGFDERGSYNAVCGFLRGLGARWYMPGELGEILPEMDSIPLPKIDETAKPDFKLRQFNVRFGNSDEEIVRWCMRLGIRQMNGLQIAHGMHTMTHPEWLKHEKPEWFALYGGKRDIDTTEKLNHLCYSNEELFKETVRWARAQFDVYDFHSVSIMPPDAYIAICQGEECKGKQIDEMGSRGKLSNHVWDFVNRVAVEVGKTHPDKLVLCCAYGANTDPPTNIEKLEPNVQVMIVGGRRPRNSLPEQRDYIRNLRAGWEKLSQRPLMIFENYPFTGRGTYVPAFVARTIGNSINATKGKSDGEDIWLSFPRDHQDPNIAFDSFQIYFTARMWWGGQQADIEAMLQEYCDRFYGPAGSTMMTFFDFSEANYQAMHSEIEPVEEVLALFEKAKSQVEPDSVYAQRLALIDSFLVRLRSKADQLSQGRGPVPKLRTVWEPKEPIVIDGKLDDAYWKDCPVSSTGRLRELQTGGVPVFGTSFKAGWDRSKQNLYLAIRCEESPGEPLNITTKDREDASIWYGDAIEILIETDAHKYYQIAVNPAAALVDLDRVADKAARFRWESQAEVATNIEEDHWTVEIRIPVTEDENDPLNQVVGHTPSQSLPWYLNICRQRIREGGSEHSAFSPTGTAGFHEPLKFAHFYDGRSHPFEVDDSVTDWLIEYQKAAKLLGGRKTQEAMDAFVEVAGHEKATELQASRALAQGALCARLLKELDRAKEIAGQIPNEFIAKAVRLENLTAERDWEGIVEQFGEEDFSKWPFTEVAPAAKARARALSTKKDGERAEADYQLARIYTGDPRQRLSLLNAQARNRESVLKDEDGALALYREICDSGQGGGADFYYGIQGVARLTSKKGAHEVALAYLDRVEIEKLQGSWQPSLQLSRAQVLEQAGKKEDAIADYRAVLKSAAAQASHRSAAEEGLGRLGAK